MKVAAPILQALAKLPKRLSDEMVGLSQDLFGLFGYVLPSEVTFLGLCQGEHVEDATNAADRAPAREGPKVLALSRRKNALDQVIAYTTATSADAPLFLAGLRPMFVTLYKMLIAAPAHAAVAAIRGPVEASLRRPAPKLPWATKSSGKVSAFPERPEIRLHEKVSWSKELSKRIGELVEPGGRAGATAYTRAGVTIGWYNALTETLEYGAHNPDNMHVLGSTGKLFGMHAAHQIRAAGERFLEASPPRKADMRKELSRAFDAEIAAAAEALPDLQPFWRRRAPRYQEIFDPLEADDEMFYFTDPFETHLRVMVKVGGNDGNAGAEHVISRLGHYAYVNALHERLGLFDPKARKGLWLGTDFWNGAARAQAIATANQGERGGSVATTLGLARLAAFLLARSNASFGAERKTLDYIGETARLTDWLPAQHKHENELMSWLIHVPHEVLLPGPQRYKLRHQKRGYTTVAAGNTMSELSVWRDTGREESRKTAVVTFVNLIVAPGGDSEALWATRLAQWKPLAGLITEILDKGFPTAG